MIISFLLAAGLAADVSADDKALARWLEVTRYRSTGQETVKVPAGWRVTPAPGCPWTFLEHDHAVFGLGDDRVWFSRVADVDQGTDPAQIIPEQSEEPFGSGTSPSKDRLEDGTEVWWKVEAAPRPMKERWFFIGFARKEGVLYEAHAAFFQVDRPRSLPRCFRAVVPSLASSRAGILVDPRYWDAVDLPKQPSVALVPEGPLTWTEDIHRRFEAGRILDAKLPVEAAMTLLEAKVGGDRRGERHKLDSRDVKGLWAEVPADAKGVIGQIRHYGVVSRGGRLYYVILSAPPAEPDENDKLLGDRNIRAFMSVLYRIRPDPDGPPAAVQPAPAAKGRSRPVPPGWTRLELVSGEHGVRGDHPAGWELREKDKKEAWLTGPTQGDMRDYLHESLRVQIDSDPRTPESARNACSAYRSRAELYEEIRRDGMTGCSVFFKCGMGPCGILHVSNGALSAEVRLDCINGMAHDLALRCKTRYQEIARTVEVW